MAGGIFAFYADHQDWLASIIAHRPDLISGTVRESGGFRLVFFQDGDVLMRSHPSEGGDVDRFLGVLRKVRTRAMLGQFLPGQAHGERAREFTAQRSIGWIYVQDSESHEFEAVRDLIRKSLPSFLTRTMKGRTEAEHVFQLVLAFLFDAGKLERSELQPSEIVESARQALGMLGEIYPRAGLRPPSPTFVISNGFGLAGHAGSGDIPLRIFVRSAVEGEVHRGVGERRDSQEVPVYPRTGKRAVLIASFLRDGHDLSYTGTLSAGTWFGVTKDCKVEIYE